MSIGLQDISFVGDDLRRPECVLATQAGALFVSDWEGGVTRIGPDARLVRILAAKEAGLRPNGIALCRDGSFLLAHLGEENGGVFRLRRDGSFEPLILGAGGKSLPPTNYVMEDEKGRIWLTVSTTLKPRHLGYRADVSDGFIALYDGQETRIVAEGLGYTNEIQFDSSGQHLYVNETFGRRLSRFRVDAAGNLSDRETVTEFGTGTFPDGLAFDSEGCVWVTSIVSNRVIRVDQKGRQEIVLEDSDAGHLEWVEAAFRAGRAARPHLDKIRSRRLKNISSLAFGGPDLKTVYLGCLLGDSVASFRASVAGRPPVHWGYQA